MRNIFQTQIDHAASVPDKKTALTRLSLFVAELQRSTQDALLESLNDPERRRALELAKQETKDALKAIDKLQGW